MILDILTHTPKWVFGLFALLVFLGFQQAKSRQVKKWLVLPLPIGMIFLSYFGVSSSFGLALLPIGLWLLGLIALTGFGVRFWPVTGVQYQTESSAFLIEGSWVPLILMMAIFFTKYAVGVLSGIAPEVIQKPSFVVACSLLYGAFSGMFAARAISIWQALCSTPTRC